VTSASSEAAAEIALCCPLHDDPDVPADAVLYRRLPPWHLHPAPGTPTGHRPSSNAFQDCDPQGVSIYVAELLERLKLGASDVVADKEAGWGVAQFLAGDARTAGFGVRLRPDPAADDDPRNEAHGELTGLQRGNPGGRQSKALSKKSLVIYLR